MNSPVDPRAKPPCSRDDALAVLRHLRESGQEAYFAGGCVRDTLLGLTPKDWDIATDAPPDRVRKLFPNTQAVGAAFGVILVRHKKSVVEIATFRADGAYEDGRHPSSVRFTSAQEDAQRRDFTINGLFLDPLEDKVIDFVGGRADLEARQVRAIGIPAERFAEDQLRLLRAVRFAARFDFSIDPATAAAIRSLAPRLKGISPERVGDELRLMLTPTTRPSAWRHLWELNLAPEICRFLPTIPQKIDFERSLFLKLEPRHPVSFGLALAAAALCVTAQAAGISDIRPLLARIEVSRLVRALRQALRLSNDESDEMAETLASIEPLLKSDRPTVAVLKRFLATETSALSRKLMDAMEANGMHRDLIEHLRPALIELSLQEVAPPPLITGDDLIAAGIAPGPAFRQVLDSVYDAQLEGRLSEKEAAMAMARSMFGK